MKSMLVLLALILFTVSINSVFAQEEDPAMNEDWMKAMVPGPMHEMLSQRVGEWEAEVKMWMDPSQLPTVTEAKTTCEPMLGGRYFKSIHTGEMMGMPYEGFEINGYDNLKKKFFNIWLDNMGTGVMMSEGTYDEAAKTINYNGSFADPMGDDMKARLTYKVIDNENNMFEMYVDMGGQEIKWMEIKYTRVK